MTKSSLIKATGLCEIIPLYSW